MKQVQRKLLAIVAFTIMFGKTYAQSSIPVDAEGKVFYTEVIAIEGASKPELFTKADSWFKKYYINPGEVIKEKNVVGSFIKGQHRFKIGTSDAKGVRYEAGLVQYTIVITTKEGKYKYEISKINWKQPSYFGMERWMNKSASDYKPVWEEYLTQSDTSLKEVITDLKKFMGGGKVLQATDW